MTKPEELGITDDLTIAQAKEILRKHVDKGFDCPCCGQPAKLYRRAITSAMTYGLILLDKAHDNAKDPEGYIHIENFFRGIKDLPASIRADIPKLRFWNLIEPKKGNKEDGNPYNGYYRVTDFGKAFVHGEKYVLSHIKIYNNKFFGPAENAKQVWIYDVMKNKFNYNELMK